MDFIVTGGALVGAGTCAVEDVGATRPEAAACSGP